MSGKEEDFKVIDKRHSAGGTSEEPRKKEGEGFVMEEAPAGDAANAIDFSTLCFSLATGALINLGIAPDPITKKTQKNPEVAKQNIDILALLQAKTKGNLTPDENQLLDNLLTEIRLKFVEVTSKK